MFIGAQVLPGDVGRSILGPFADAAGRRRARRASGCDPARSSRSTSTGSAACSPATWAPPSFRRRSAVHRHRPRQLAQARALAFFMSCHLRSRRGDRCAERGLASATAYLLAACWDRDARVRVGRVPDHGLRDLAACFPVEATPPAGAGPFTQVYYLILPAIASCSCCSATSCGWRGPGRSRRSTPTTRARRSSRACRSGVVWSHVLRNSLLPTIAVVATQIGLPVRRPLVLEVIFNYNGLGRRSSGPRRRRTSRCSRARCCSSVSSTWSRR